LLIFDDKLARRIADLYHFGKFLGNFWAILESFGFLQRYS